MKAASKENHSTFSRQPFKLSKAASGLILTALILIALLVVTSIQNIHHAQSLMENFLIQKGETVIRSVEAGSRTSMMHHMMRGIDLLGTLLQENIQDEDIIYIRIVNRTGEVVAQAGEIPHPITLSTIEQVLSNHTRVTTLDKTKQLFELSDVFKPVRMGLPGRHRQNSHLQTSDSITAQPKDQVISIGLVTTKFDTARIQDQRHAVFMAVILFLVGSAGLYFMYLYNGIRVARAKLADMQLYTDNVIESIPAGLVTLDAEDKIVAFNNKAEEFFTVSRDLLNNISIEEALPDCSLDHAHLAAPQIDLDTTCFNKNGRMVPVRISGSPLLDQAGNRIGTVLIIRDMSLIQDMQMQLERSRRMAALGRMAAGIAHEIRNPLSTLRGFAQFFGNQAEEGSDNRHYADVMVSEVDRLNHNISGLLQFARPREPHFNQTKIDDLIRKTVTLMQPDFEAHSLSFHWQDDTGIELQADPDLLLQVLLNLLKNSISATAAGGTVSLQVRKQEDTVILTVADTGQGMNAEEREKMFDPFFTTKKSGTGLGLAVSHQIIEQHHGGFEVETAIGKGTQIDIVLPVKQKRV